MILPPPCSTTGMVYSDVEAKNWTVDLNQKGTFRFHLNRVMVLQKLVTEKEKQQHMDPHLQFYIEQDE